MSRSESRRVEPNPEEERRGFLKLINNSSSLNKRNHDRDSVWISDLNLHRFFMINFVSPFSP